MNTPVSKSQISIISSLQHKKFRQEHGLFLVEGHKSVLEFAASPYHIIHIYYTSRSAGQLSSLTESIPRTEVSEEAMAKMSGLKTPQGVLALIQIPETKIPTPEYFKGCHTLWLDGIQDPGNLGTIIRTADWFGIQTIICSEDTADVYNPKVVQASMGSIAHVNIYYAGLPPLLSQLSVPVYGAFLNGESVYETKFGPEGALVLGNEGNGISSAVAVSISKRITIPRFGRAESLNVAISAGIFCAMLKA